MRLDPGKRLHTIYPSLAKAAAAVSFQRSGMCSMNPLVGAGII